MRGPHVSEGERGAAYQFGGGWNGPRAVSPAGPKGSPGSVLYFFSSFLFFFFYFLVSFVTFANLVQIASNQLCKVSKIQNNNPE
jgi:hypothetical protein